MHLVLVYVIILSYICINIFYKICLQYCNNVSRKQYFSKIRKFLPLWENKRVYFHPVGEKSWNIQRGDEFCLNPAKVDMEKSVRECFAEICEGFCVRTPNRSDIVIFWVVSTWQMLNYAKARVVSPWVLVGRIDAIDLIVHNLLLFLKK